jgi:hypothetical protein
MALQSYAESVQLQNVTRHIMSPPWRRQHRHRTNRGPADPTASGGREIATERDIAGGDVPEPRARSAGRATRRAETVLQDPQLHVPVDRRAEDGRALLDALVRLTEGDPGLPKRARSPTGDLTSYRQTFDRSSVQIAF